MDRATLLQIFQSRPERSDYSKLQKQGRTFYQEARRQASNTQARHISVSFLFVRAEEVYVIPVCLCSPSRYRRLYILSGFVSTFVCSLYICISVRWSCRCSRGCCRVSCLQTRFSFFFFFLFFLRVFILPFTFLSFVPVNRECSLPTYARDVSSVAVDLVAFHPNS